MDGKKYETKQKQLFTICIYLFFAHKLLYDKVIIHTIQCTDWEMQRTEVPKSVLEFCVKPDDSPTRGFHWRTLPTAAGQQGPGWVLPRQQPRLKVTLVRSYRIVRKRRLPRMTKEQQPPRSSREEEQLRGRSGGPSLPDVTTQLLVPSNASIRILPIGPSVQPSLPSWQMSYNEQLDNMSTCAELGQVQTERRWEGSTIQNSSA